MKKLLYRVVSTICLILVFIGNSYGRDIKIEWQKCFGGLQTDYGKSIIQTLDGGYIFCSETNSKDGDIGGNFSNPNLYDYNAWVVKLDHSGNIQWKKILDFGFNDNYGDIIIQTKDSSYLVSGYIEGVGLFLTKISKIGNIVWNKTINNSGYRILSATLKETSDGGIIFAGREEYNNYSKLYKLDKNGNIRWEKAFDSKNILAKIVELKDNSYALLMNKTINLSGHDSLIISISKIDSLANVLSDIQFRNPLFYLSGYEMIKTNDDDFIVAATAHNNMSSSDTYSYIFKTDTAGNVKWQKNIRVFSLNFIDGSPIHIIPNKRMDEFVLFYSNYLSDIQLYKINSFGDIIVHDSIGTNYSTFEAGDIFECRDGGFVLIGTYNGNNVDIPSFKFGGDTWVAKIFFNPNYIIGNIFNDNNSNCIQNINEKGLPNYSLKARSNLYTSYSSSQTNGKYYLTVPDTGLYNIELLPNSTYPYFSPSNCNSYSVHLRDSIDTVNFALKPTMLCTFNTVNVSSAPPFRIGRPQTYTVNYCNNGTMLSTNTYITLKLDSLLDINSTSIPYTTLSNHTYRFNIGDLDYLSCDSFTFVATPNRNSTKIGQTLCTEAHIYPDTVCTSPNYTGAYIVASAQCTGDSVELKLQNRGGDMQQIKHYIVIEDQVMRINQSYQLPHNGILTEKLPLDSGHTYRITAEQEDNLPPVYGDKYTTAAIEGCRPNPADNFSVGYFIQFPNYDGEPFRALSCNTITGSYDPNIKEASPIGYDAQHYIEKNTQIDYQINFQNTGNDTAFKVVVVDTIAQTLDINSIQLNVASHAYQFQRIDSNVVQFVFDNIKLVDSFRNEPKSHGFVKFKIQQKLNNPMGTKIYNKADIYFDYNAPITTNQTYHTVGQNFISVNLISSIKNPKYNVKEIKILPNPFRDKTQVFIESNNLKNPVLMLMNVQGQIIKIITSSNNNTFDIYRDDLSNGMYLFKIMQDKDEVTNGKIIVQ